MPRGPLTFPPGVTTRNIVLRIVNDRRRDRGESIVVSLVSAINAQLGARRMYRLSILDND